MPSSRRSKKRILLYACIVYALVELIAFLGLTTLQAVRGVSFQAVSTDQLSDAVASSLDRLLRGDYTYLQHDPVLGWSLHPNSEAGLYRANAQGLRADREYTPEPRPGTVRIAAFGDSFTHGDDVEGSATWAVKLEARLRDTEVINFGVPAYGPGQAYLRYKETDRALHSQVVLIGFMPENIHRAVNVWRPFYKTSYSFPFTKPRFTITAGRLSLIPNPLTEIGDYKRLLETPASLLPAIAKHDLLFATNYNSSPLDVLPTVRLSKILLTAWNQQRSGLLNADGSYNTSHPAFAVVTNTLKTFYDTVVSDGANALIVVLPVDILAAGAKPSYAALLTWLREQKMACLDVQMGFDRYNRDGPDDLHVGRFGHYSPRSNGIVARYLSDELIERGWVQKNSRGTVK